MHHYPITLNLSEKKVVVVGGGKVAERKIAGLLDTGAVITVVSPEVTERIRQFSDAGQVIWLQKPFSNEDIDAAFMVFAATDDRALNVAIKNAAAGIPLVTIADNPQESDFHVPAQVRRGRLNIAVSTGGASPILARNIRRQLGEEYDERYEDYLEFLYQARKRILQDTNDPALKKEFLEEIAGSLFFHSKNREAELTSLFNKAKK